MTKSATEIMQEIMFSAVLDAIVALKAAAKGVPNTLLRDLNALHANTTLADLPPELQAAISGSVRAAFTRLLKEGYSVSPAQPGATPRDIRPRPATAPPPRGRPPFNRGGGDPAGARPRSGAPRRPKPGGA